MGLVWALQDPPSRHPPLPRGLAFPWLMKPWEKRQHQREKGSRIWGQEQPAGPWPPPAGFGADPRWGPSHPQGPGTAYVTRRKGL